MIFLDTAHLRTAEIFLQLTSTAEENRERDFVPAYYFNIVRHDDQRVVGTCDLRVGHTGNTAFGGNIGYTVHLPFRGKHYAGKACLLLFQLAKEHDMGYVRITCATDNIASQRTCDYCGATSLGITDVPEWHDMYKNGRRQSCIYEKKL